MDRHVPGSLVNTLFRIHLCPTSVHYVILDLCKRIFNQPWHRLKVLLFAQQAHFSSLIVVIYSIISINFNHVFKNSAGSTINANKSGISPLIVSAHFLSKQQPLVAPISSLLHVSSLGATCSRRKKVGTMEYPPSYDDVQNAPLTLNKSSDWMGSQRLKISRNVLRTQSSMRQLLEEQLHCLRIFEIRFVSN